MPDNSPAKTRVSAAIFTGAVIMLSLAVFGWSFDTETAKIKEKVVFEYISYGNPSNNITVYLFSYGTIDNVEIKNVCVSSDGWFKAFSNPPLYFLNGTHIPDQDLDVGEDGYFILPLSTGLASGYYNVKVVTARGSTFDSNFVV